MEEVCGKKGNTFASKETVDVTEDPGLIKNRSDLTEDPGLIKNRSDCNKVRDTDPLPIAKNSSKYARNKLRDTDPLPIAKNSSKDDQKKCLRAEHDESSKKRLRAQNESAHSRLQAQNESANTRLRAQNESANNRLQAQRGHDEFQNSCSNVETIFASHNQGDEQYSVFSRGSQCTCMSLSVILTMFENNEFSTSYLDRVLYRGDNLYKKVVMDLMNERKFKSKLLSFDELPRAVEYNDKLYSITKHASVTGIPIVDSNTSEAFSLHEAVVFAFSKSDNLLIMIGAICSALVRRSNRYIFFDSHSHGKDALSSADGKAVMKFFPLLDDVIAFLYAFYNSANIELTSQFEILPVSLQRIMHRFLDGESEERPSTSRPNLIGTNNFTKNTTNFGNTENVQTDRLNYMKEYMRKKRQEKEFHDKELASKRKTREDEHYRQGEATAKRVAREDKDYRVEEKQRELASKQKARENVNFREKEMTNKRELRENQEYREEEKQRELLISAQQGKMKNIVKKKRKENWRVSTKQGKM